MWNLCSGLNPTFLLVDFIALTPAYNFSKFTFQATTVPSFLPLMVFQVVSTVDGACQALLSNSPLVCKLMICFSDSLKARTQ